MKAALVAAWGEAPRCQDVQEPGPAGEHEALVDVLAAALSPRVRSQAAGSHYTSTGELPLIPGIDGVGRMADGSIVYFLLPDTAKGAMAERVVVDRRRCVPLPADVDAVAIAAAMNPAMASWVALRRRVPFEPGQRVPVLGATGSAGRAAVAVAHRLGAGRVTAIGRGTERLDRLAEDCGCEVVELDDDPVVVKRNLARAGAEADIVLDFLWGEPTRTAMYSIVPGRKSDEQALTWIQIGSVAGSECAIPSAALRAVNLRIIGSGQGSVTPGAYRDEIAALAGEIQAGMLSTRSGRCRLPMCTRPGHSPTMADGSSSCRRSIIDAPSTDGRPAESASTCGRGGDGCARSW